jgi:hypothetical protein
MGRPALLGSMASALVFCIACSSQFSPQKSSDGRFTLQPSIYENSLVRLTVVRSSDGAVVDTLDTNESDAMKWVAGWAGDDTVVFWGSDSGSLRARRVVGDKWEDATVGVGECRRLDELFADKYRERRTLCR